MEFEKVRDIIVETLGCEAEQVRPAWLTIWAPTPWLPWSW